MNQNMKPSAMKKLRTFAFLLFAVLPAQGVILADSKPSSGNEPDAGQQGKLDPDYPLTGKYVGPGLVKDFLLQRSRQIFKGSRPKPALSYSYIRGDWMMNLNLHVKELQFSTGSTLRAIHGKNELPVLAFEQSSQYLIRLYYPLYLGAGYSLIYLYPTEAFAFPLKRSKAFQSEVGAGISLSLVHQLSPRLIGRLQAQRWRGTATTRLQGVRMEFGVDFKI